uniref:Uncharacterized protein n=1 Tax=Anguilla anguilla TaxID=7936 RepID=A0A0E9XR94_ANGAN
MGIGEEAYTEPCDLLSIRSVYLLLWLYFCIICSPPSTTYLIHCLLFERNITSIHIKII